MRDPRQEIITRTQHELRVFLSKIKSDPPKEKTYIIRIVNNLVTHVQSDNVEVQEMAIQWIRAFAAFSGPLLFNYISGILTAVLPNLSFDEQKRRESGESMYKSKN